MPSTSASVVSTSSAPRSATATAASSPIGTGRMAGEAGKRCRISCTSPRSPSEAREAVRALTGVLNGTRLADHGHFDLAGVLQLALDAPGDVFRQPDRLFVRDALALDEYADFAAGLQGKSLGDALERVGDAFEFFQAFDVGLENVAAGAGAGGRDRIGGLDDHRLDRRPVDVHMMRGHRQQHRLGFAVLAQEVEPELQVRALEV